MLRREYTECDTISRGFNDVEQYNISRFFNDVKQFENEEGSGVTEQCGNAAAELVCYISLSVAGNTFT